MEKICASCGRLFPLNPKVSHQSFCSEKKCQKKRRSLWQQKKRLTDRAYRENQRDAQKSWVKRNRGYWKKYREGHTEYAERNRKLQKVRNQKKRDLNNLPDFVKSKIAKMDLSNPNSSLISGYYMISPITGDEIAKMDVIVARIDVLSVSYEKSP